MLEEVLLAGERPRELDDDVSGRGVAGVGGSTKTMSPAICAGLRTSFSGFGIAAPAIMQTGEDMRRKAYEVLRRERDIYLLSLESLRGQ